MAGHFLPRRFLCAGCRAPMHDGDEWDEAPNGAPMHARCAEQHRDERARVRASLELGITNDAAGRPHGMGIGAGFVGGRA